MACMLAEVARQTGTLRPPYRLQTWVARRGQHGAAQLLPAVRCSSGAIIWCMIVLARRALTCRRAAHVSDTARLLA